MGEALIADDTSLLCYDHLQFQNCKVALAHVYDLFLKAKINGTKIMTMFSLMIGQYF